MPLSIRYQAFANSYARHFNATRAAKEAGYTERSAYAQGCRLLKNDEIVAAVKARIEELTMSEDEFMVRLAEHARADMGDFAVVRNKLSTEHLDPDDPESEEVLVRSQEIEVIPSSIVARGNQVKKLTASKGGVSIELVDQLAALVKVGEILGKFVNKHEVSGKDGGPITIDSAVDKALKKIYGTDSNT